MAWTWADVSIVAPGLASLGASAQAAIIARVNDEILVDRWGSQFRADQAAIQLAAHIAYSGGYLGDGSAPLPGGPVVSESVGPISASYAQPAGSNVPPQYASTRYGQEFYRLLMSQVVDRIGLVA